MAKQIDRQLDVRHLADQLGCQLVYQHAPTALFAGHAFAAKLKRFTHDDDLRKWAQEFESFIVLHSATFRDGEYTIRYFDLCDHPALKVQPEQPEPTGGTKKVTKKKATKKRTRKKSS